MYSLIVDPFGTPYELTHSPHYTIKSITGLDPPDAVIALERYTTSDKRVSAMEYGSAYKGSYIDKRTVTITMAINAPCDDNRARLYRYFVAGDAVTVRAINAVRTADISGYVRSMQIGYFEMIQTVQIVIDCPRPALQGDARMQGWEKRDRGGGFNPEELIPNAGDLAVDCYLRIEAITGVSRAVIANVSEGTRFVVAKALVSGDVLEINSTRGQKSVYINGGNALRYIASGSKWPILLPGDNVYTFSADELWQHRGTISYTTEYAGM